MEADCTIFVAKRVPTASNRAALLSGGVQLLQAREVGVSMLTFP